MRRINWSKNRFVPDSLWLIPGLGIKRWLLLLGVGTLIVGMGFVYVVLVLHRLRWLPQIVYDIVTLQAVPVIWRIIIPLHFWRRSDCVCLV
ncbi:MAG: hypothetical protein M5U34_35590 [Chloroflexi bacterium]|nr:hypothetical protein [Chloroflexota bacterium]